MRIDPHRLLRLGELIRQGSFKHAADKLAITQSALSQSITQMEAEVGVRLIERTPKGIVPTVYGEALAAQAHEMEVLLKRAASRVIELATGSSGTLTVAGLSGGPVALIALTICKLREQLPALETRVIEQPWSAELLAQIDDRTVDLAICNHLGGLSLEGKKIIPFFEAKRVICVRADHPVSRNLTLKALADFPFVSPGEELGLVDEIEEIFRAAGLPFPRNRIHVSNSLAAAKQIVLRSDAYALLSEISILPEIHSGTMIAAPLPRGDVSYWNHLVVREDQLSSAPLRGFANALTQVCRELHVPLHPEAEKAVARGLI